MNYKSFFRKWWESFYNNKLIFTSFRKWWKSFWNNKLIFASFWIGIAAIGSIIAIQSNLNVEMKVAIVVVITSIIAMILNSYWQGNNLEITRESITEQVISNAVTLSANKSSVARKSGIISLYELAKNDKQSIQRIHKFLSSYVQNKNKELNNNKISDDIQLALDMLTVRREYRDTKTNPFVNTRLDLRGAHLQGAYLIGAQLRGAVLRDARLQRAALSGARLQGADLMCARLQGANLIEAKLQGAVLSGARLQGANLIEAKLQGAYLTGAQLQGANLARAQLQGADLRGAQLQGANLARAQLQGANLARAQLQGANLTQAQLQGADDCLLSSSIDGKFGGKIRNRINREITLWTIILRRIKERTDQETELNTVILKEGITQKKADDMKEEMTGCHKKGWLDRYMYTRILWILKEHTKPEVTAKSYKEQLQKEFKEKHKNKSTDSELIQEMAKEWELTEELAKVWGFTDKMVEDWTLAQKMLKDKGVTEEMIKDWILTQKLAEDFDFTAGSYTEAEAEKWIKEYEKAMSNDAPEKEQK